MVNSLSTLQRDGVPYFDREWGRECALGMGSGMRIGIRNRIGNADWEWGQE